MKIVRFKKDFKMILNNDLFVVKKNMDYVFADIMLHSFLTALVENNKVDKKYIIKSEDELRDVYSLVDVKKEIPNKIILVRTGGIGDLIALSSIVSYLRSINPKMKIIFVTQNKYSDLFDWYEDKIDFVPYFKHIGKRMSNTKTNSLYFEGVIEMSKRNWFELQYKEIGVEENFLPEYGRPKFKTTRPNNKPSNIDTKKPSILLNIRSTAIVRSMRFKDVYLPLLRIIRDKDVNIYIHKKNMTQTDYNDIQLLDDDRIKIIKADSLGHFLLDIFDSDLTISVDTAMVHFREGINKPGIGIYGPFPTDARTKYYKYIDSFDLESPCKFAPCFIHAKKPLDVCLIEKNLLDKDLYAKENIPFTPCLNSSFNMDIHDKLEVKFRPLVESILDKE